MPRLPFLLLPSLAMQSICLQAQTRQRADLMLVHGTAVTMDPLWRVIEDAGIAVDAGHIAVIGKSDQITAD